MNTREFQKKIWEFYKKHGRHDLPWRDTHDPYNIFVSEVMLQQTQVQRVIPKYEEFTKKFPTFKSLANASQADVIRLWQGLGYNRRALFLKKSAEHIVAKYDGKVPDTEEVLRTLPGIGPNTAGSLLAFVHNMPIVFIETNIRRVFLHEFFQNKKDIPDKELNPLIEKTLHRDNPREWYYALMDFGSYLASKYENANMRSRHYTKQSKFKGSKREVRGKILKMLTENGEVCLRDIKKIDTPHNPEEILKKMEKEGFVKLEKEKALLA